MRALCLGGDFDVLVLHHEVATTDDDALAIERRCDARAPRYRRPRHGVRDARGPRAAAAATTARATGCGKCSSRQAEVRSTSSSVQSGTRASTRATRGRRLGERSRLIEHDGVGGGDGLEMLGTLDGPCPRARSGSWRRAR